MSSDSLENKQNLPSAKTILQYEKYYKLFKKWLEEEKLTLCNDTMLIYFKKLSKDYSPTSLWFIYTGLKMNLSTSDNFDISSFWNLKNFLKKQSADYKPKKCGVLSADQINLFMETAPDIDYLADKVVTLLGICGSLRCSEIHSLKYTDVLEQDDSIMVNVRNTKNEIDRSFIIINKHFESTIGYVKQYLKLRSFYSSVEPFLLQYRKGGCGTMPQGINTIVRIPRRIATFLKLPQAHLYTGHMFRLLPSTVLANFREEIIIENPKEISDYNAKRMKLNSDNPKSIPEMQKNLLKRLRTKFDSMTRDDLENLIAMKICESIINNSEFKELRTIVENQSKTIKTYKEQLISLVLQYDKLKLIIKYLTSALKLKNRKYQKPLRIRRNVAVQRNSLSVPISLNVLKQQANIKTDQLLLPDEKPSATCNSIPIKMTPGNSSIQQRSNELKLISDSKPPVLVLINSGKPVLNASVNTSDLKLSNTFGKSSINEDPKINSLFKDVTMSSNEPSSILLNSKITITKKILNSTENQIRDINPDVSTRQSNFNKLSVGNRIPHRNDLGTLKTLNHKDKIIIQNAIEQSLINNQQRNSANQLLLPDEKPSATCDSISIQMTPGNSNIQQRSNELKLISDSKPPVIVHINPGKPVLNARVNTSDMKLSNAFGKGSINEDPNIDSLCKDATFTSNGRYYY